MSYQEQLSTPQKLFYMREQIDGADYELHPTDKLIDESDVLAHQALSRILNLIRSEDDSTK